MIDDPGRELGLSGIVEYVEPYNGRPLIEDLGALP
jgi:hypothetical protein